MFMSKKERIVDPFFRLKTKNKLVRNIINHQIQNIVSILEVLDEIDREIEDLEID